jgi:hypothetical protein
MRNFNLNIAGYNIGFEASANGPELKPAARFLRNIKPNNSSDILIRVHSEPFNLPKGAERVFLEISFRTLYLDYLPAICFRKKCGFEILTYIYGMGSLDLWRQG